MIETAFLLVGIVALACAVLAVKKRDFNLAAFQLAWIVMLAFWYLDFSISHSDLIVQFAWCVWSIQASMLLNQIATPTKPSILWLALAAIPLSSMPLGVQVAWSAMNIVLAAAWLGWLVMRHGDGWIRTQALAFICGFWVTDLSFMALAIPAHAEPTASWVGWSALETAIIFMLAARIKRAQAIQ